MPVVESVCIGVEEQLKLDWRGYDLNLIDEFFLEKWLPRVSVHLKSLSVSQHWLHKGLRSYVLPLLSAYCTLLLIDGSSFSSVFGRRLWKMSRKLRESVRRMHGFIVKLKALGSYEG
ncbi:hypothetical protein Tco_1183992, partial [Tanacetum coccineum]